MAATDPPPRAPMPAPKGWESLARQQSRWLFDLLKLALLGILALLARRFV